MMLLPLLFLGSWLFRDSSMCVMGPDREEEAAVGGGGRRRRRRPASSSSTVWFAQAWQQQQPRRSARWLRRGQQQQLLLHFGGVLPSPLGGFFQQQGLMMLLHHHHHLWAPTPTTMAGARANRSARTRSPFGTVGSMLHCSSNGQQGDDRNIDNRLRRLSEPRTRGGAAARDDVDDGRIVDAMRTKLFGNFSIGADRNVDTINSNSSSSSDDDDSPATCARPHANDSHPGAADDDALLLIHGSDSDASGVLRWLVRLGSSAGSSNSLHMGNNNDGEDDDDDGAPSTTTMGWTAEPWTSELTRVSGCVATVHIQTTVQPRQSLAAVTDFVGRGDDDRECDNRNNSSDDDQGRVVSIRGTADAMVSRGLLVLVSKLLHHQPVGHILRLRPDTVTDLLGLRVALSQGRNDGIASMIRTIQQHLTEHQQQHEKQQLEIPPLSSSPAPAPMLYRTQPEVERISPHDQIPEDGASLDPSRSNSTTTSSGRRVALLLSGGVDSSVALHLLLREGYDVTCYYLKIWLQDELQHLGTCPWEDDYNVCVAVCQQANVPLRAVSLQDEYHQSVVQHSIQEAELGRTPNPDILCNSMVKFGCFLQHLRLEAEHEGTNEVQPRGFDYIASGHYAQVERDPATGLAKLYRAPDPVKDQSYFLCALDQDQLQRLLFPIGHLQKQQVRELAMELRLANRARPDSQGLCFLGKLKFDDFLESYLGERPGPIVDAGTGERLGQHRGVWYHTVGQRKGIGRYLHPKATSRGPWYVVRTSRELTESSAGPSVCVSYSIWFCLCSCAAPKGCQGSPERHRVLLQFVRREQVHGRPVSSGGREHSLAGGCSATVSRGGCRGCR
jgi:tRNA-5-taurinomethyluridine 2-sulfurtransferase